MLVWVGCFLHFCGLWVVVNKDTILQVEHFLMDPSSMIIEILNLMSTSC